MNGRGAHATEGPGRAIGNLQVVAVQSTGFAQR